MVILVIKLLMKGCCIMYVGTFLSLFRVRLISLAAQKFVSDVANDALQHCKTRSSHQGSKGKAKDRRCVYRDVICPY